MEYFMGSDPIAVSILNGILDVLKNTTISKTKSQDECVTLTLYLGYKEMHAINSIEIGDSSIERNYKTGDVKLYGFHVIPVLMDSYAKAVAAIDLKQVYPIASCNNMLTNR